MAARDQTAITSLADLVEVSTADPLSGGLYLHASAVSVGDAGLVIIGPSGSGKSTLALALLALGAGLICDDTVLVRPDGNGLLAVRPPSAPPLVEARGIGLLNAGPVTERAPIAAIVDLARPEALRLPPRRMAELGSGAARLIRGAGRPDLHHALLHMLRHGQADL